ncbi:accessory factor UbiK family protein [uncultured Thiodictyon sp.]|uniref:accessory factor UbiK family protein n=1 Tax=uncultured Thiodictyon sp. TaxID=1846217 RepID=UPI0025FADCC3|nr:accessory factor UbiK family protein [uncultured Thiodictyon sp.]
MLDPKPFDDIAQRVAEGLQTGLKTVQEDRRRNRGRSLAAGVSRLDLVNREEFGVQTGMFLRTGDRVSRLEAQVMELERFVTPARTGTD